MVSSGFYSGAGKIYEDAFLWVFHELNPDLRHDTLIIKHALYIVYGMSCIELFKLKIDLTDL